MEATLSRLRAGVAEEEGVAHLTVRTDGPDDALLVPSGVETVVVDDTAQRVILPEGVQVVRLQRASGAAPVHAPPPASQRQHSFGDMVDELIRAKRSVTTDSTQTPGGVLEPRERTVPPSMSEKSLSLPSCPPTPPGSRSMATSMSQDRTEPLARAVQQQQPSSAVTAPLSSTAAPLSSTVAPPFTAAAPPAASAASRPPPTANGSTVRFTGSTEKDLRDPLIRARSAKLKQHDSFGWREEFEHGEVDNKRTFTQRLGRFCADVLCCWVGI